MALMTGNEYVESLRKLNMEVYIFGERVECPVDHPIIRPSLNSVKMTYDLAQEPEYEELMTATSHLTRKKNKSICSYSPKYRRFGKKSKNAKTFRTKNSFLFSKMCRNGCF